LNIKGRITVVIYLESYLVEIWCGIIKMEFRGVKRKLQAESASDDYSAGIEEEMSKFSKGHISANTIDSDDEVEEDEDRNKAKYDVLKSDQIEGELLA